MQFHRHRYRVGNAFDGYPVALYPTDTDGVWDVYFATQRVACIDQRSDTRDDRGSE